jgi:hypothetical protein
MGGNPSPVKGTAVAIREEQVVAPAPLKQGKPLKYSLPELREIATAMYTSGMFKDLKNMPQAMVKILAGAEQGYGPFQSLRAYHVIEGKPVETSGEISARIKRSPKHDYKHWFIDTAGDKWDTITGKNADLYGCVVVVRLKDGRKWVDQEPVRFNMEDARDASLAGKANWKSYKRAMLFARTITEAARAHCADLFGGPIYTPEELGADVTIDANGDMILTGSSAPPPPENGNGEKPVTDRTVDNEQTRATGVKTCTAFASNRKIPDEHRHEIAQAFFGRASTKELTTFELRQLYDLLRQYVKDRGELPEDAKGPQPLTGFPDWLQYQQDSAKESAGQAGESQG